MDTLLGGDDMATVKNLLTERGEDRPLIVVNTHSHWDHVWGNMAFPGTLILAHRLCRETMERDAAAELARYHPQIEGLSPVEIVYPNILLSGTTVLSSDITVEIHHTPGHTPDSMAVFLPEENLLIAGDTVEYPFPMAEWAGHIADYQAQLEHLSGWRVRRVIPGHGPASAGPELLRANVNYLLRLREQAAEAARRGLPLEEANDEIPLRSCLEDWIDLDGWGYEDLHLENVKHALNEAWNMGLNL